MKLLDPYDTRLNFYSKEVIISDIKTQSVQILINDMKKFALGERNIHQPRQPSLVGLSAPQAGVFLRVILVDICATPGKVNFKPKLKIFINPKIVWASKKEILSREGCYSTGNICGAVYRSNSVKITALDENGKEFIYKTDHYFQSCIIQHEIDHLNGVRFPSRVRKPEHLHIVDKDDFQSYRDKWRTWKKLCPFESWLKMYEGQERRAIN